MIDVYDCSYGNDKGYVHIIILVFRLLLGVIFKKLFSLFKPNQFLQQFVPTVHMNI